MLSGIETNDQNFNTQKAFRGNVISLPIGGFYKFRKDGESTLQIRLVTMHMLQTAVATDNYDLYKKYSKIINEQHPLNLKRSFRF